MLRLLSVSAISISLAASGCMQTDLRPEIRPCMAWNTGEFFQSATNSDVQECIDRGADTNGQDEMGLAPLHLATMASNSEALSALLEAGARTTTQDYLFGRTPMHYAAQFGTAQTINVLHAAGADIDAEEHKGATPLHVVVAWNNPETLDALLEAGADVNARDKNGVTPLHNAAEVLGSTRNIEVLLRAGAYIEARDKNDSTPLHWAAATGKAETINALLEAGADIEAKSNPNGLIDDLTPLHYAARLGSAENVTALLDAGADPLARAEGGFTPFELAAANDKLEGTKAYWRLNEARFK